jgi:hypothetical protein
MESVTLTIDWQANAASASNAIERFGLNRGRGGDGEPKTAPEVESVTVRVAACAEGERDRESETAGRLTLAHRAGFLPRALKK